MTSPTPQVPDTSAALATMEVAVKLAQINGTMETGFATLNGRLDVALTRTSQLEDEVATLRAEVESLKRNRWPLPAVGALTGVAGAVAGAIALVR